MHEKLSKIYRKVLRHNLNKKNRKRLRNSDISIFSSNCVGGVISHELGLPFLSPTINMFMKPHDFIKFLKRPEYYFSCEVSQVLDAQENYPVVKIDDIVLYCSHYRSFTEFCEKWYARCKRVNSENLYIIMAERDGCEYQDIVDFDSLPYKNKIVFVQKPMPEIRSSYYIPGSEVDDLRSIHKVRGLTEYKGRFTGKRVIDDFDYVSFLNSGC